MSNHGQLNYTDETIMPFGKFKGEALEDIPEWYFKTIYSDKMYDQDLKAYIEDNFDVKV